MGDDRDSKWWLAIDKNDKVSFYLERAQWGFKPPPLPLAMPLHVF